MDEKRGDTSREAANRGESRREALRGAIRELHGALIEERGAADVPERVDEVVKEEITPLYCETCGKAMVFEKVGLRGEGPGSGWIYRIDGICSGCGERTLIEIEEEDGELVVTEKTWAGRRG